MQPWQREMYSPPRRRPASPRRRRTVQRAPDAWAFGSSTSRDTEAWLRQGHVSATSTGLRPCHEKRPLGRPAPASSVQAVALCSRCRRHTELEEGDEDVLGHSHRLCRACQAQLGAWTNAWAIRRRGDGRRGQRTSSPPRHGPRSPPRGPSSSPRRTAAEVGFGSSAPRTTHIGTLSAIGFESTAQGLTVSPGVAPRHYKASGVNERELHGPGWQSARYAPRQSGYETLAAILSGGDLSLASVSVNNTRARARVQSLLCACSL